MPESVIETISKAVDAPPIDIETIAEGFITASDTLAHSPGRELILLYLMTSVRSGIREHFKLKEGPDRIERMIVTIGTDQIGMGSHRCEAAAMLLGSIQMMPEIQSHSNCMTSLGASVERVHKFSRGPVASAQKASASDLREIESLAALCRVKLRARRMGQAATAQDFSI